MSLRVTGEWCKLTYLLAVVSLLLGRIVAVEIRTVEYDDMQPGATAIPLRPVRPWWPDLDSEALIESL
jgi:hypothetical protein